MKSANSRYWLCQFIGWGLVVAGTLFFARAYDIHISKIVLFGRVLIIYVSGILTTHFLRLFIKWRGWIMQSVEKVVPKLAIATIVTSLIFSLLVLIAVELFHLTIDDQDKQTFTNRLLGQTVSNVLLILAWVLIYYFCHFIEKSRRQQMDTLQLETLIKELELKTIKAHINPHFIFNSLNSIR